MQRHVRAEFAGYPARQRCDFINAVVFAGDQQRRDLQPASGVVVQVAQGVEHRLQAGAAQAAVEIVGEGLEVDVGGVHGGEEFARRLGMDVAGGDGDIADALLAAGQCGVDGVLGKDHRVVVGVGDGIGTVAPGGVGDHRRGGFVHQAVHVFRPRDVPVLAELAGEVAAGGAERQHAAARMEVIERLLLDRIDAETGGAAVGGQLHRSVVHLADEAGAALAFVQLAVARAQVALDASVGQGVPPAGGVELGCGQRGFSCHFCTV